MGIWIEQTEGAKFWMKVFSDLKARGCQAILIAVTGSPAWKRRSPAVFPRTTLQTCIVPLLRHSLDFANWKQRKPLATALRTIYAAPSADLALAALDVFERGEWGRRLPTAPTRIIVLKEEGRRTTNETNPLHTRNSGHSPQQTRRSP